MSDVDWGEKNPPRQKFPAEMKRILDVLNEQQPRHWLWADAALRNLGGDARENLSRTFRDLVASLDKFETRYFLLFGKPALLVWISRAGSETSEDTMIRKSEAAAIATRADEVLCLHLSVHQDGLLTRPICLVSSAPTSIRSDYDDLRQEAEAMLGRTVDFSNGLKPKAGATSARK